MTKPQFILSPLVNQGSVMEFYPQKLSYEEMFWDLGLSLLLYKLVYKIQIVSLHLYMFKTTSKTSQMLKLHRFTWKTLQFMYDLSSECG